MWLTRRELVASTLVAGRAGQAAGPPSKLGMPGPYPGRVIAVHHPASIVSGAYQAEAIRGMMRKGMMELTGAPGWVDAWRVFAEPGDVVGIKVCPVGGRRLCSDATVLNEIIEGLKQAGVRPRDIVICNRYRQEIVGAGIHKWLPEGVRYTWACEAYDKVQLAIDGYDPEVYLDIPIIKPGQDPREPRFRRSYVARFLTQQMNKFINLPVLKHHSSAGVTLALKNMTYGMVNNVNRSHQTGPNGLMNACGVFIAALADLPVFRQKAVLHILDGIKGGYEDGPGVSPKYIWEHKTLYFATDPVAVDRVGWKVIDEKRVAEGLQPVALAKSNRGGYLNMQPEHIEFAGALGLGVFEDAKIELRKIGLG